MKKLLAISLLISIVLGLSGCGDKKVEYKDKVTLTQGQVSQGITIGKELAPFTFKDQFDKEHSLEDSTKKIIFAFTKPTGHIVRTYMSTRKPDYLTSRDTYFIADISGMPSIIAKMFAIPDMQEGKYPILLIRDKEHAKMFINKDQKKAIMLISLDHKIVKNVKFVTTAEDLKKEID